METSLAGMYFLMALIGVFSGLYVGFYIRSIDISKEKKLKFHKPKRKKQKTFFGKIKRVHKKSESLLTDRISDTESFTSFKCDSFGENPTELIQKNLKTQDEKYINKAQKSTIDS